MLQVTLDKAGHLSARFPKELLKRLAQKSDQVLGSDGTDRRIRWFKDDGDDELQKAHYSGKKKGTR